MEQVDATQFSGDKVTRVINNLGHQVLDAIDILSQKTISLFRILYHIKTIKNLKSEYERRVDSGTYRLQFDFTSFNHTKTELLHEVTQFLSIPLNSHVVE